MITFFTERFMWLLEDWYHCGQTSRLPGFKEGVVNIYHEGDAHLEISTSEGNKALKIKKTLFLLFKIKTFFLFIPTTKLITQELITQSYSKS